MPRGHNYLRCTKKLGPCSQPYVREEEVTRQVNLRLGLVALQDESLRSMGDELATTRDQETATQDEQLSAVHRQIAVADDKLARLTTAYTESVLDLDEYRLAKAKLVEEKTALQAKSDLLDRNPLAWFEPLTRFLNTLFEATLAWSSEDLTIKA